MAQAPPIGGDGGGLNQAILSVSPPSPYNLGSLAIGAHADLVITITNAGNRSMVVTAISVTNTPTYSLIGVPTLPQTVAVGGSFSITLRFAPTALGTFNA